LTNSTQNGSANQDAEEKAIATDERWMLARRVAASQHFAKATQLREILLYIVRRAIVSHTVAIREQEIACNVLGRRGDFNPSDDNIVRVQVGHLRKKLELYFAGEGAHEPVELTIPRGTYIPRFATRAQAPKEKSVTDGILAAVAAPAPLGVSTFVRLLKKSAMPLMVATAASMVFLLGWMSHRSPSVSSAKAASWHNPIVTRVFVSDLPVSIVLADASLVVLQNSLHTDISIDDYISKEYPGNILGRAESEGERAVLKGLAPRRFTSLADLNVAVKCVELAHELGSKTNLRFARYLNARDFEKGNFILVGSRVADPWVALFESNLNFAFEEDPHTHIFHFRNKHPAPGEQSIYIPDIYRGTSSESYVDIAILPNLTKSGYVILLNGASMEANEAAVDFIFAKELPQGISSALGPDWANGKSSIEIFLRDRAIDGVVSGFDVISVRRIPVG
jgi:hypothetical protein